MGVKIGTKVKTDGYKPKGGGIAGFSGCPRTYSLLKPICLENQASEHDNWNKIM
jgi:hypothetical protein